jgi:hypothetical protein
MGLWAGTGGNLKLVAREGDQAPGAGGATFASFGSVSGPLLNDLGETAFIAKLQGAGITSANDFGIWATDSSGQLRLIVREGDTIEVAPNDFRVLDILNNGGDFPFRPKLNNLGQIAFYAKFTNGQGIIISDTVAIPEPASLAMLVVCAFCAYGSRGIARK